MRIACEKCDKIMDAYFKDKYKIIKMDGEDIVLCKDCYEKLSNWMYEKCVETDGRNSAIDECLSVLYINADKIISIPFYEKIYNEMNRLKQ